MKKSQNLSARFYSYSKKALFLTLFCFLFGNVNAQATFGYDTYPAPSTFANHDSNVNSYGTRIHVPSDTPISHVGIVLMGTTSMSAKAAIYSGNAGSSYNFIAETNTTAVSMGKNLLTLSTAPTLPAGDYLVIFNTSLPADIGYNTAAPSSQTSVYSMTGFGRSFPSDIPSYQVTPSQVQWGVYLYSASALPVQLSNFSATAQEEDIQLKWTTASETNNLGFEIQHSTDGQRWDNLGFVEGQGNTTEAQVYDFLHAAPVRGLNYYRLKQLDHDGKFEYSETQTAYFVEKPTVKLTVYPNPTPKEFTISIHNPNREAAQIKLFDTNGSLVWSGYFSKGEMPAYWEKMFSISTQAIYYVESQIGGKIETQKIMIADKR